MKALVKIGRGENDIELREVPEPVCGPGQVKIRVRAVGICGTDIHGHPSLRPPVILGHELAGDIDAGACPLEPTTVLDLVPMGRGEPPVLVRQGRGELAALGLSG